MTTAGIICLSIAMILSIISSILSICRIRNLLKELDDSSKHETEQELIKVKGNLCVCCGAVIPEGRQVCLECEDDGTNT